MPTIEEYGIDREAFLAAAEKMSRDTVISGSPANTRKPVNEQDVSALYFSLVNTSA